MAVELERNCKWHFAKQQDVSRDDGPNNPATAHFDAFPYQSLIRESIQNSLDAIDDKSKPVKVTFKFQRLKASTYKEFFKLKEHIQGVLELYGDQAKPEYSNMLKMFEEQFNFQDVLHYIRVSDFNTKGMPFETNNVKSPFYAFLRSLGVTVKDDQASGGSFGFGKSAYFVMSPINTVLVSTMTKGGRTYFEGASSLCTHYYIDEEGKRVKYQAYGYYDNQNGLEPSCSQLDIPDKFYRQEQGTDICIMGVKGSDEEKQAAYRKMIEETLRHLWMAIYKEKLVVEVGDTIIDASTLNDLMLEYFPVLVDKKNNEDLYNPRPYYECIVKQGTSENYCCVSKQIPWIGDVRLYVWKNKDARDSVIHMRKQFMFINRQRYNSGYGYYAVFACEDEQGNRLLKDLEDASHRKWVAKPTVAHSDEILKELRTFIEETIKEIFECDKSGPLTISGLESYLYIPEELLTAENEDTEDNPFFGAPTGETQDKGVSPLSDIDESSIKFTKPSKESLGKLVVTSTQGAERSTINPKLGGHVKAKDKKKRQGKGNHPNEFGYNPNNDAPKGKFLEQIPVRYRVMAEEADGKVLHTIIIKSDYDVSSGQIEVIVGGEDKDEAVKIIWSSQGEPVGNIIRNLQLDSQQNNFVSVQFEDNMKHAIKLTAYELK